MKVKYRSFKDLNHIGYDIIDFYARIHVFLHWLDKRQQN